jgi:hypothetical protein
VMVVVGGSYLNIFLGKNLHLVSAVLISLVGLTGYYSQLVTRDDSRISKSINEKSAENKESIDSKTKHLPQVTSSSFASTFLFIVIYAAALVFSIFSNPDSEIFKNWDQISPFSIFQLAASILLAFFLRGCALLLIMTSTRKLQALVRVILVYLFSMLVTGLATFILDATFGAPASQIKDLLISVYFVILTVLVISHSYQIRGTMKLNHDFGNIWLRQANK